MPVETTQFARVMRDLGVQQIFALSSQAKGRVERMLETFQNRLVTELRLARASSIDEAGLVLQEFLPRFNARFAVAAEQPEAAYRPVPDELSLTETICLKDTRKVARDNTVKYQWRVLQLLPEAERPSYAGLRVEVLERADGELLLQYQGKAVDFQEGPPPSSALWGADTGCSPDPELHEVADGTASSHLNGLNVNVWLLWNRLIRTKSTSRARAPSAGAVKGSQCATGCTGRPRQPSRPAGRQYRGPGSRDFPSGPLPGTWAWPRTPRRSTPWLVLHPPRNSAPRSEPRPRLWPHR